jgi:hypothetical protein
MNKKKDKAVEPSAADTRKARTRAYEKQLASLQVELAHLQAWVKETGARIVLIFEGRDAAGKGGMIKRITERVSPRVFRVIALPHPEVDPLPARQVQGAEARQAPEAAGRFRHGRDGPERRARRALNGSERHGCISSKPTSAWSAAGDGACCWRS